MENLKQHPSIFEEITSLIALRQEGGYWDFKRQWHEKKQIYCMILSVWLTTFIITLPISLLELMKIKIMQLLMLSQIRIEGIPKILWTS